VFIKLWYAGYGSMNFLEKLIYFRNMFFNIEKILNVCYMSLFSMGVCDAVKFVCE